MTPLWVHWAARAAGTILLAGGAIALWRNDPTRHYITLAPARLAVWWTARRVTRRAWVDGADLPTDYYRGMVQDMVAARSRRSRARKPATRWAEYRRRCRLQAAGFHGVFPGGPRGALP